MTEPALQSDWVVVPQVKAVRETTYGVRTHYVHDGKGEPVILIHGGGSSGEGAWGHTIPALAPYFHAYALDLIGAGYSDKPLIEYSFQTHVEHLAGFIDALGLDGVRLAGNSRGAYVAIKYALDYPDRVKQVALTATGTVANAMGLERPRAATSPPRFDGTRESIRKQLELLISDPEMITDDLIDKRMAVSQLPGYQEAHESIQHYTARLLKDPNQAQVYDVHARLPQLTIPWCFIWGTADVSAPLDPIGLSLHAAFPEVPFHIVEGAGHQAQNDKPEEVHRLLLEFFGAPAVVPSPVQARGSAA